MEKHLLKLSINYMQTYKVSRNVAGVLDEPYSQLSQLSGVAVQARQST
jgi:hypothetical protein